MYCISYQAPKFLIKKKKNLLVNASTHTTFQATNQTANRHESSKTLQRYPSHVPFSPVFTSFLPLSIPSKPIHSLIQSTTASLWHLSTRESKHTKYPNANETELKKKKKEREKPKNPKHILRDYEKKNKQKIWNTLISRHIKRTFILVDNERCIIHDISLAGSREKHVFMSSLDISLSLSLSLTHSLSP